MVKAQAPKDVILDGDNECVIANFENDRGSSFAALGIGGKK